MGTVNESKIVNCTQKLTFHNSADVCSLPVLQFLVA